MSLSEWERQLIRSGTPSNSTMHSDMYVALSVDRASVKGSLEPNHSLIQTTGNTVAPLQAVACDAATYCPCAPRLLPLHGHKMPLAAS